MVIVLKAASGSRDASSWPGISLVTDTAMPFTTEEIAGDWLAGAAVTILHEEVVDGFNTAEAISLDPRASQVSP